VESMILGRGGAVDPFKWLHSEEQETGWFILATKLFPLCFLTKWSRALALAWNLLKFIESFCDLDFRNMYRDCERRWPIGFWGTTRGRFVYWAWETI